MSLKVMSLCSGIGGLELALQKVFNMELVGVAETNPTASNVLDERFGVKNYGDITDARKFPRLYGDSIVVAGFPCQPVSQANSNRNGRLGIKDKRWLIKDVVRIAERCHAQAILLENVRGIYTANKGRAFEVVIETLAAHGYGRMEWRNLKASEISAPHRRDRWFCIATTPHASFSKWRLKEPETVVTATGQTTESRECVSSFGKWGPAIQRWEQAIGRDAPQYSIDTGKHHLINPAFVEWMMGFPKGWITGLDLDYSETLRCLGNAVVPRQASIAYKSLLNYLE